MPLREELQRELHDLSDIAKPEQIFIFHEIRGSERNLETPLKQMLSKVGLPPYPKPFVNLQASRQTELMAEGRDE